MKRKHAGVNEILFSCLYHLLMVKTDTAVSESICINHFQNRISFRWDVGGDKNIIQRWNGNCIKHILLISISSRAKQKLPIRWKKMKISTKMFSARCVAPRGNRERHKVVAALKTIQGLIAPSRSPKYLKYQYGMFNSSDECSIGSCGNVNNRAEHWLHLLNYSEHFYNYKIFFYWNRIRKLL